MSFLNRYVPEVLNQTASISVKETGVEVFKSSCGLKAMGFKGRAEKPSFYFSFRSVAECDDYISRFVERNQEAYNEKVRAREDKKNFQHTLKVGDVLHAQWGWEQTNNTFIRITAINGKNASFVEIGQEKTYDGDMTGRATPLPEITISGTMSKRVMPGNRIRLSSFSTASPLERDPETCQYKPMRFTEYA